MLTTEQLKQHLFYDPNTGVFTRLRSLTTCRANCTGYVPINVLGRNYYAHRLAWLWMTGAEPKCGIDHINGVKDDNRWVNLRLADKSANAQNIKRARKDNLLGKLGVSTRAAGSYFARITLDGKRIYLGTYRTPEQAHQAYLQAKRRIHEANTL